MSIRFLATSFTGCRAGLRTPNFSSSRAQLLVTELTHTNRHVFLPGQLSKRLLQTRASNPLKLICNKASGASQSLQPHTTNFAYFSKSFPKPHPIFGQSQRFFSSNQTFQGTEEPLPPLSPPSVGGWLLVSSLLVYAVIVVGGITRLTESGLSITEWRPITGVLPPLSKKEWEEEFEKYKATPEFKMWVPSSSIGGDLLS